MKPKPIIQGSWKNKIVASCLQDERDAKDFEITEDEVLDKLPRESFKRFKEIAELLESDPILRNSHTHYEKTREEMWYTSMQKFRRVYEIDRKKWFIDA